jgi:hypothetical protein
MVLPLAATVAGLAGCGGGSSTMSPMPAEVPAESYAARETSQAVFNPSTALDVPDLNPMTSLIDDGSFETPVAPAGGLNRYSAGQKIGAWTVLGAGTVDLLGYKFQYAGYTFTAFSGKQQLDLTGNTDNITGVQQTLATTAGHVYTLSFYVGNVNDPGGGLGVSSTVDVLVNGKHQFTATNSKSHKMETPDWEKFTYKLKATSAQTTLALMNGDPSNDTYNGIDEVTLTF